MLQGGKKKRKKKKRGSEQGCTLLWKRKITQQDLGLSLLNGFITAGYFELIFNLPWDSHTRTTWHDLCSISFKYKKWEFRCAVQSHPTFSQGKCDSCREKCKRSTATKMVGSQKHGTEEEAQETPRFQQKVTKMYFPYCFLRALI